MKEKPVALVTGASSGFGLAAAIELAKAGITVLATMRNPSKQKDLYSQASEWGVNDQIKVYPLDVTKPQSIKELAPLLQAFRRIDVLVNNAGFAVGGFVEEVEDEHWRAQFETNFFGLVSVTKAVLPMMRAAGKGRIINISSISGLMGFPGLAPYAASKFAVEGFSESLRLEVKPFGVDVILVEPGSYGTRIWSSGKTVISPSSGSPYLGMMERIERRLKKSERNFGDPIEVARLIVKAATVKHPKLRYPIGQGVKLGVAVRSLLPWKWWEGLVQWNLRK